MLDASIQDFERATGPWHAEWIAIPESFVLTAGSLHQAKFALGGLIVDEAQMSRNLDLSRGLIVAEAVMMGLAPQLGHQKGPSRRLRRLPPRQRAAHLPVHRQRGAADDPERGVRQRINPLGMNILAK